MISAFAITLAMTTPSGPCPMPDVLPSDLPRVVEALALEDDPDATAVIRMALEDAATQAVEDCETYLLAVDASIIGSGGDPELVKALRHRSDVIRQLNDARAVRNALLREQDRLGSSDAITQAIARTAATIKRLQRTLDHDTIGTRQAAQGATRRASATLHELERLLIHQAVARDMDLEEILDALLTDDASRAAWQTLLQQIRRDRRLPLGTVPGDRVDLVKLIGSLAPSASPQVQAALTTWAAAMHTALDTRQMSMLTAPGTMRHWLTKGQIAAASEAANQLADDCAQVVQVNQDAIDAIAPLLDADTRERLLNAWTRATMPSLHRPDTLRSRALDALSALPPEDARRDDIIAWIDGYDAQWMPLLTEHARIQHALLGRDSAIALARRAGTASNQDVDMLLHVQDLEAAMADTSIWWHQRLQALLGTSEE